MNDESIEVWIQRRAKLMDQISTPPVDVSDDVLASLAHLRATGPQLDKTPLVVGGLLVALAASIVAVLAPSLAIFKEPWISFWLI